MSLLGFLATVVAIVWFAKDPSYITVSGLAVCLSLDLILHGIETFSRTLSQKYDDRKFKEMTEKLEALDQKLKAVQEVSEEAKKHLVASNMAAGFKIGK